MKKTLTKEITVCDYCLKDGVDVEAIGVSMPSEKDVCNKHFVAFSEEIRLPEEFGSEMSGMRVCTDPGYDPAMVIEYKKEKTK